MEIADGPNGSGQSDGLPSQQDSNRALYDQAVEELDLLHQQAREETEEQYAARMGAYYLRTCGSSPESESPPSPGPSVISRCAFAGCPNRSHADATLPRGGRA